jgi:8-oxo-dGTP pyrophosphatase MutT (NUDIX family)
MVPITYHDRILACSGADLSTFVPWSVGGKVVGHVHRERVPALLGSDGFAFCDGALSLAGADFAERSAVFAGVVTRLVAAGELRPPLGECYPVLAGIAPEPLLQVDRTAVAWFGVRAAGVHLNGWVRRAEGLYLWVAERSRQKRTFPGHLDNLVAGGSAIGFLPRQTLEKECHEEAGIPADLARRAVEVGALRYEQQDGRSFKPDRLDLFDLELPADFVPRAIDGEVETFCLWPVEQVAASLRGGGLWKPNCALVVIDFLLRRGALDHELPVAERWKLWQALRSAS